MPSMRLLGLLASARALSLEPSLTLHSPLMSAAKYISSGHDELGLLPFNLREAMLIGETKQVHLKDPRLVALFEKALDHEGCVGQLLVTDSGSLASVSSLLEITEVRTRDAGMWADLRAVGRVRIHDVSQTEDEYVNAHICLHTDARLEQPLPMALVEGVQETYSSCHRLARRLREKTRGRSTEGLFEAPSDSQVAVANQFEVELESIVKQRREVMCERGLDASPVDYLDDDVQALLGVSNEEAAELQLFSFCAASCLGAHERAHALTAADTVERLKFTTAILREKEARLAAQLALAGL
ncbi:hypothetical protein AB1Y20_016042 [Prymnesium parvum]|uniref:Lon N-terminal domain-containing protein n=1 Tax=Prymnesium parvum TaxID=97485 RepID=A0AB34JYW0_PRYPA